MNDNTVNPQTDNTSQDAQVANTQEQEVEMVGGVACPIDPMERLQCESCQ